MKATRHRIDQSCLPRISHRLRSQFLKEPSATTYSTLSAPGTFQACNLTNSSWLCLYCSNTSKHPGRCGSKFRNACRGRRIVPWASCSTQRGRFRNPPLPEPARLQELVQKIELLPQLSLLQVELDAARALGLKHQAQGGVVERLGAKVECVSPPGSTLFAVASPSLPGRSSWPRQSALDDAIVAQDQSDSNITHKVLKLDIALLLHEVECSRETSDHFEQHLISRLQQMIDRTESLMNAGEVEEVARCQA